MRPVCEKEVVVLSVFPTSSVQVWPASLEARMPYPVTGDPPSEAGAVQDRLICVWPTGVAFNCLGGPGTSRVVAETTVDGGPVSTELIADTR